MQLFYSSRSFAKLFDVPPCALKIEHINEAGEKPDQFYTFFSFNISLFIITDKPVLKRSLKSRQNKRLKDKW